MRLLRYSLLIALVGALLVPAVASSQSPIDDCADDGVLQGKYSAEQLAEARRDLPSDLSDYSDCLEALQGAGASSGSGSQGPAAPSASDSTGQPSAAELARARQERAAIEALAGAGGRPTLSLDGKTIRPGDTGLYDLASVTHQPPLPVTLALIATALLTLSGLAVAGRRRLGGAGFNGLPRLNGLLHHVPRLRR
jgi:hypothetical protein